MFGYKKPFDSMVRGWLPDVLKREKGWQKVELRKSKREAKCFYLFKTTKRKKEEAEE